MRAEQDLCGTTVQKAKETLNCSLCMLIRNIIETPADLNAKDKSKGGEQ